MTTFTLVLQQIKNMVEMRLDHFTNVEALLTGSLGSTTAHALWSTS